MKIGSLVKQYDPFRAWVKFNSWMKSYQKIGMIISYDHSKNVQVLWEDGKLMWSSIEDIEVL